MLEGPGAPTVGPRAPPHGPDRRTGLLHVAIVGNGITGVTAALTLRRLRPQWRITMISGESTYPFSRPALMYLFLGHMRYRDTKLFPDSLWNEQRIELVRDWVTGIDFEARRLALHRGQPLAYDRLLLATGSKPNRFGWPGQDLEGVQGFYGLPDLTKLYENVRRTRRAVIVGGGLIGIELAEMLHSCGIDVTFLVREASYWDNVMPQEESAILNEIIRERGMDLRLKSELAEILDDGSGRCAGVVTEGERIDCQLVGLTAGVSPNIDLVRESELATGRGILVDRTLRASIEGVFAAGDCAEIETPEGERNLIQQVWYTGKLQGECVAHGLAGEPREYDPGLWYNSAKFLDLEYQTYGRVGFGVPGEQSLIWIAPDRRHSIRLVHVAGKLIGVNLLGIRFRHEVCERWLAEGRDVEFVLAQLEEAHFDPELFHRFEDQARAALEAQYRGALAEAAS